MQKYPLVHSFIPAKFSVQKDQPFSDVRGGMRGIAGSVQQTRFIPHRDRKSGKSQRTFTVTVPVSSCRSEPYATIR
jgi:hypothetical protein